MKKNLKIFTTLLKPKKWEFSFHTTILEKQTDRILGNFAKLLKP